MIRIFLISVRFGINPFRVPAIRIRRLINRGSHSHCRNFKIHMRRTVGDAPRFARAEPVRPTAAGLDWTGGQRIRLIRCSSRIDVAIPIEIDVSP